MKTASILDGKHVASTIKDSLKQTLLEMCAKGLPSPVLAVIRVGHHPASVIYVNNKIKTCLEVGFKSISYELSADITQTELLNLIDTLNHNHEVNGILVQLPLPEQLDAKSIIEHISYDKDVDGFHPYNLGRLAQGNPNLRPCTPYGIIQLLQYYQIPLRGLHAVVVGASNIVGRPMALELLLAGATVTICHKGTNGLKNHIQMADLVVIATGVHNLIKVDWLQSKQIIIDVGMHRDEHGTLHGDINFIDAQKIVSWITPVPFGVGPMTISTLLQNTLLAYDSQNSNIAL